MLQRFCSLSSRALGRAVSRGLVPNALLRRRRSSLIPTLLAGTPRYAPCPVYSRVRAALPRSSILISSASCLVEWAASRIFLWIQSAGGRKRTLRTSVSAQSGMSYIVRLCHSVSSQRTCRVGPSAQDKTTDHGPLDALALIRISRCSPSTGRSMSHRFPLALFTSRRLAMASGG